MATTWSPTDKDAGTTLSGANLTATSTTGSETGVRATTSLMGSASGIRYLEMTAGATFGTNSGITLGTGSSTLNSGAGKFMVLKDGNIYVNNSAQFLSIGAISPGDVVGVLIDFPNLFGWFNRNGGNWNGSATTVYNNTNAVGLSGIFSSSTPVFPIQLFGTSGSTATTNFGATSFAHLPSGASAWDATGAPVSGIAPFNPPLIGALRNLGGAFQG